MYVSVCKCVSMYVNENTCKCMYVCMYVNVCQCLSMYVNVVCMYACMNVCVYECVGPLLPISALRWRWLALGPSEPSVRASFACLRFVSVLWFFAV